MEYTFRNSAKEDLVTICLEEYGFVHCKGDAKEVISYTHIVAVRIGKSSARVFYLQLIPDGHRPITISSRSFTENGLIIDQWQGYSLFVRVLHHHLKDKSPAVFTSGGNRERLLQWASFSALFSFLISVTADYMGFGLMNPYIQALIMTVLVFMMFWVMSSKKLPKTYKPTEIPLQYLP